MIKTTGDVSKASSILHLTIKSPRPKINQVVHNPQQSDIRDQKTKRKNLPA